MTTLSETLNKMMEDAKKRMDADIAAKEAAGTEPNGCEGCHGCDEDTLDDVSADNLNELMSEADPDQLVASLLSFIMVMAKHTGLVGTSAAAHAHWVDA